MTQEQELYFSKKLQEIDNSGALAGEFAKTGKLPTAEELEEYPGFTDRYDSYEDFIGDKNALLKKFYDSQNGKMPTEARLQSFIEKHPTVSAEDVNKWFTNVNKYKEEEIKARDDEAGKIRRAREVKEWGPWRNLMASDYEKERYIQDPTAAMFGEESSGFWGSSAGSKADFAAGAAGLAGDLVPGAGALIGPTIRTVGRDIIGHKIIDSPYEKDWSQIGQGALVDYGANLAAWKFANARRMARGAKEGMSPALAQDLKVRGMKQDITEGIKILDSAPKNTWTDWDIAVNAMPESGLKKELRAQLDLAKTNGFSKDDIQTLNEIVGAAQIQTELTPGVAKLWNESEIQSAGERAKQGLAPKSSAMNEYEKELARVQKRGLKDKIQKAAVIASDALNRKKVGQSVYQVVPHVAGKRPSGLSEESKKPSFNEAKNWYLKNYERDFEMGFDPRKEQYPDAAKIAAYEEYWANKRKKSGEIYDQWEAKAKELTR